MRKIKTIYCFVFAALLMTLMGIGQPSYAGGPLFVSSNGQPVRWPRREVIGGPLNTRTVDAQGRVIYRVDSGPLGPISNNEAVRLVDRIFRLYNDIPTSTIEFVNGGPILNPRDGKAVDITGGNAGLVLSGNNPSFQNPIVFDSDGSITGRGGVLGFFGFLNFTEDGNGEPLDLLEGIVVLNGSAVNLIGKVPFIGVFTHEFGHFAGPLDHSQIYGWIASGSSDANAPDGFSLEQRYDIFAPFVETVYPFVFRAPGSSLLSANGFGNSGSFVASLSFDDVVAMSTLYPAPGYLPTEAGSQFGGINGRVIIKTSEGDLPITGLNVIARRISRGKYPPSPAIEVFPNNKPDLDSDGAPLSPQDRPELDPLITATSLVSGVLGGSGNFRFVGLPPGDYMLSVERINPNALGGSSIGPRSPQLDLVVPENYNGADESSDPKVDNPKAFTPVTVTAGAMTSDINIILNGFGGTVTRGNEKEPNDKVKKAQRLSTELIVAGMANATDASKVKLDFTAVGVNFIDGIEDLYRIDLASPAALVIILEAPKTDFDLYLFSSVLKNGKIPLTSDLIVNSSAGSSGS
ncbi:MAG: hypothetical protein AB1489_27075, partial [Acidobacteriota bacterium]